MPVWFFVLLAIILVVAVAFALAMAFDRRSTSSGDQNTTIVEGRSANRDVTVAED